MVDFGECKRIIGTIVNFVVTVLSMLTCVVYTVKILIWAVAAVTDLISGWNLI